MDAVDKEDRRSDKKGLAVKFQEWGQGEKLRGGGDKDIFYTKKDQQKGNLAVCTVRRVSFKSTKSNNFKLHVLDIPHSRCPTILQRIGADLRYQKLYFFERTIHLFTKGVYDYL